MRNFKKLNSPEIISLSNILKDKGSNAAIARSSLISLGQEIGQELKNSLYKKNSKNSAILNSPLSVIITTKADSFTFGHGLSQALMPSKVGYMNFEGRRGPSALNTPVREINLPDIKKQNIDYLVIAKSVLATGCTAISLTKTAINEYNPKLVIIVTIFYSIVGLNELNEAFPNARIFFVGEPYPIRTDGMLDVELVLPDEIS